MSTAVRRPVRAGDVVVAVLFGIVALPLSILLADAQSAWVGGVLALVIAGVVTAGMIAVVILARGATELALWIAWGTVVIQLAAGLPPLPANLATFVVLFWTGYSPVRRLRVLGAVSAGVAAIVVTVYLYVPAVFQVDLEPAARGALLTFVASLVSFALAWTIGLLVATVRAARAERQEALAEQERGRIAREMHDVVAHSLAVIIAQADGARYAAAGDPAAAQEGLKTVSSIARSALAEVRVLLAGLRHQEASGPQPTLDDLDTVIEHVRAAGLAVDFDRGGIPSGVPISAQLAVHRIVQESLTNALRHGRIDRPAAVTLDWRAGEVIVTVASWIDPSRPPSGSAGHGITGMRERARIAGGELLISTDERFVVRASIPFETQAVAP